MYGFQSFCLILGQLGKVHDAVPTKTQAKDKINEP